MVLSCPISQLRISKLRSNLSGLSRYWLKRSGAVSASALGTFLVTPKSARNLDKRGMGDSFCGRSPGDLFALKIRIKVYYRQRIGIVDKLILSRLDEKHTRPRSEKQMSTHSLLANCQIHRIS